MVTYQLKTRWNLEILLIFWWRQRCPSPRYLPLFCNYQIGVTVLRLRNFGKIMLLVNVSWTRSTICHKFFQALNSFLFWCCVFFSFQKKKKHDQISISWKIWDEDKLIRSPRKDLSSLPLTRNKTHHLAETILTWERELGSKVCMYVLSRHKDVYI